LNQDIAALLVSDVLLLGMPDGNYVIADEPGVVAQKIVTFATGPADLPIMTIEGFALCVG
jgi:hypothetical protein